MNRLEPCNESRHSRTEGKGKISVMVASFRARKSAQKRYEPSALGTSKMDAEEVRVRWRAQ